MKKILTFLTAILLFAINTYAADNKIPDLPELTSPATNDVLAIEDIDAAANVATKKITHGNLESSIDHTAIQNIGSNTHAQIDTHIGATEAHGATGAVVGTTNTQTLTNKTLASPVLDTSISGTAFKDEDNLASDSATSVASQQSIKAYVDAQGGGVPTGSHGDMLYKGASAWLALDGNFNVKAYGAVGDGAIDDTSALQSAITAAQNYKTNGGGNVVLPGGTYRTTSTLAITKPCTFGGFSTAGMANGVGVHLPGAMSGAIIKWDGSTTSNIFTITSTVGVKIHNLIIDANDKIDSTGKALLLTSVQHSVFEDIAIISMLGGTGIYMTVTGGNNCMFNRFDRISIKRPDIALAMHGTSGSNSCYNTFGELNIEYQKGSNCAGIWLGWAAGNVFNGTIWTWRPDGFGAGGDYGTAYGYGLWFSDDEHNEPLGNIFVHIACAGGLLVEAGVNEYNVIQYYEQTDLAPNPTIVPGGRLFCAMLEGEFYYIIQDGSSHSWFHVAGGIANGDSSIVSLGIEPTTTGHLQAQYGNAVDNNRIDIYHNGSVGWISSYAGDIELNPAGGDVKIWGNLNVTGNIAAGGGRSTETLKASELNDSSDPHLLIVSELKNTILTNVESIGADEWDFPARTEGWNFIFIKEANQNITLDPYGSENWYVRNNDLEYVLNGAGLSIINTTNGRSTATCFSTESAVYCTGDYGWETGS